METSGWLREFLTKHGARVEMRTSTVEISGNSPSDLRVVATQITAFKFDDLVKLSFRGVANESPLPATFPIVETLCCDDSGNFLLCDYQASAAGDAAKVVYLSHDPFAFVIVAESMRDLLGQILHESGKTFRPLQDRYQTLIESVVDRFEPQRDFGIQRFANTGDGIPLFLGIEVCRTGDPGLVLDIPR